MDQDSIEEVCASEVYPKQPLQLDDNSLTVPFSLLSGEGPLFIGRTTEGTIILSNYRLFHSEGTVFNVPLGLIEYIECRDIFFLQIYCKDGRSFRCSFSSSEECQKWLKRLQTAIQIPEKLDNHFGFVFYSWTKEEHKEEILSQLHQPFHEDIRNYLDTQEISTEAERMGFDLKRIWKISSVNADYELCPSYPRFILAPASINDAYLKDLSNFRYSRRIPAVVWRHQQNGCVIARSSQPKMGIWSCRNEHDENLIQAISDACVSDPGYELKATIKKEELLSLKSDVGEMSFCVQNQNEDMPKRKLLIVDARSYAAAMTNRAKGGGYECDGYYSNCEIQYMGLANIHNIRKSFSALRTLCAFPDEQSWLSSLENTKWFHNIAGLIRAALLVVNAVDTEIRPVLVHCSDGWDRTSQIVALAELMLDPYYRTKKGFKVLIEREWLEFGHKFADRCGHSDATDDTNERSPIFLQWLDCVYQIQSQLPCYFEFNQQYLIRLVLHTYSCLFGTFMCNTDQSRRSYRISARTFSVWPVLNERSQFHNYLFSQNNEVIRPSCLIRDIKFWAEVYLPSTAINLGRTQLLLMEETTTPDETAEKTTLVKTKSCDNISYADHSSNLQRRNSDPNLVDSSFPDTVNFPQSEDISEKNVDVSLNLPFETFTCEYNGTSNNNDVTADCTTENADSVERTEDLVSGESAINGSTDTLVSESSTLCHEHVNSETNPKETTDSISNTDLDLTSKCDVTLSTENVTQLIPPTIPCNDTRLSTWCQAIPGTAFVTNKRSSGSSDSCNCSYTTPQHSRTPSSGFPATPCDDPHDITTLRKDTSLQQILDVDGLKIIPDAVQERVKGIVIRSKNKIATLQNQLMATRSEFFHQVYKNCQVKDGRCMDADDSASVTDSACSGEQHFESGGSENSWEQLDHPFSILWVPDHAASNCTGCKGTFWAGRRRHHCRKCGRVFCYRCSSRLMPVPTEQLFDPVRVCNFCFEDLQIQCQQSAMACDKVQKMVIAAASN